jgi:hypothetical protein
MKRIVEFCLGFSLAAAIRGIRLGPKEAYRGARRGFSAAAPFATAGLPEIGLDQILGAARVEVKLNVMSYEDGMMPLYDAIPLLSILVMEQPREVLEIGTFMGHTTRAMADNLKEGIIHTADLPEDFSTVAGATQEGIPKDDFHLIAKRVVGREFKGSPVANRIVQHFGDTAEVDFREFGSPSFFFIDGSHTYEYCKNDSEKCLAISKPGSTFLWHDCDAGHPGVVRCLSEWRAAGKDVVRIAGSSLGYWKRP